MLKKIVAAFLPPVVLRVRDFSRTPGGRRVEDGPKSGEHFRRDVLLPLLSQHRKVVIVFDDVFGIASSWLNEVFAHPDVRAYEPSLRFGSTGDLEIYDRISKNFLKGARPYRG